MQWFQQKLIQPTHHNISKINYYCSNVILTQYRGLRMKRFYVIISNCSAERFLTLIPNIFFSGYLMNITIILMNL